MSEAQAANINAVPVKDVKAFEALKSGFVDYTYFEDTPAARSAERNAFINNSEYVPQYDYPKLDFMIDSTSLPQKKHDILEAVMELEAAKDGGDTTERAEYELYASYHEIRLKKIMLVEAAHNLHSTINNSSMETNRDAFNELGEAAYGPIDARYFRGMIDTEQRRLKGFVPENDAIATIAMELETAISSIDTDGDEEKELLDEQSLAVIHTYVLEKYADVLAVVPDTDDDTYYNAEECAAIMNQALAATTDLAERGWRVVIDPQKANPSTGQMMISLPGDTRRTANELRRLIIHEQEVHARRARNGANSEVTILRTGSADYADVEEGLGVLLECAVAGTLDNPSFNRARDRYITAGLAKGVDGAERDSREVFEILWRMIAVRENDGNIDAAKLLAYKHVDNAYRGTQFWMKGVVYPKLKVYYEGLAKNAEFFTQHIDDLDAAFDRALLGKYNHTSQKEFDQVTTLMGRGAGHVAS